MEDFIRIWENAFPAELCKEVIDTFEEVYSSDHFKDFLIDHSKVMPKWTITRKDLAIYLQAPEFKKNALCQKMHHCLQSCLEDYCEDFLQVSKDNLTNRSIFKIQRTLPTGGYHIFHCENTGVKDNWARELVWMIYLNDRPDGEAETEFLYQKCRIKPKQGTIVIWPAGFTHMHRGNTVFTQPKYIATGWYYKFQNT